MQINTLSQPVEILQNNFNEFKTAYPIIFAASESINQGFDTLLSEKINNNKDNFLVDILNKMLFGTHVAWINSYIFTSTGYKSSGLVELRRAIEFCCYAAKVCDNKERAESWINQREDSEARKKFTLECSIPDSFKSNKYKFLRSLLIIHEEASYYGAHGNFESIVFNYTQKNDGKSIFHYQMNQKYIPNSVGEVTIIGFRILQAYNKIFKKNNYFINKNSFSNVLDYIEEEVKKARMKLAEREYDGVIPEQIFKNIKKDNQEKVNRMFLDMINDN